MSQTIKENIGYCKVFCKGSPHNGADGTVIKESVYNNVKGVLVCINSGMTQGSTVWLHESNIVWVSK